MGDRSCVRADRMVLAADFRGNIVNIIGGWVDLCYTVLL